MMNRFFSFFLVLILSAAANAQAYKYSNEFLSIGVSARSFAMGNSTVASVTGESSNYWNPSTLTQQTNPITVGLMHAEYFAGLSKYDYIAGSFSIDEESAFGASLIRFAVDDIPDTRELIDNNGEIRFDRVVGFSAADYAFLMSYARKMPVDGLSVGGNVKIIRRVVGDFASSWGFGIDISALYLYKKWKFAAVMRDATTTFNSWSYNMTELEDIYTLTGNELPDNGSEITLPKLILGTAYEQPIGQKFGVLGEINLDISTDGKRNVLIKGDPFSIDPHVGLEFNYNKMVFIRTGINNIQKEYDNKRNATTTLQPNLGVGINFKNFTIDYALTDIGNVSAVGYSHIFSLSYAIQNIKKQ